MLAWLVFDSFAVRPHYLAFFGAQAGGPAKGHEHLVDSSLDWGMNLPALKQWLDKNDPLQREPLFLGYFGTDKPAYHDIRCTRLPGFLERRRFRHYPLKPGYYAISASLFRGVYTAAFGPWNLEYEKLYRASLRDAAEFEATASDPVARARLLERAPLLAWEDTYELFDHLRFARLCAWLRHHGDPPARAGHAIFIWKLDYAALEAALIGPPAELAAHAVPIRRFRRIHFANE
jgi:hypothetical protein